MPESDDDEADYSQAGTMVIVKDKGGPDSTVPPYMRQFEQERRKEREIFVRRPLLASRCASRLSSRRWAPRSARCG